eukprot:TRINITY_DN1100_c0_g3_i1.p3 TRINITY_DN1100_c0_g3~~TRINITY_DN1100_c0_g3_i1.p3  ORF type:complete len:188 (+),score=37.50 TRINITY_DN1100_c0_g3_i1:653-1216(+)
MSVSFALCLAPYLPTLGVLHGSCVYSRDNVQSRLFVMTVCNRITFEMTFFLQPLWSASDKQSEIDRLNEELDNLEGELENAIIAKWNALEQLQSCQQGESVAEITPMPRKSAFEQNVLAAKAALANSDNSDDEPPFQPSDIEALNRETLEVDEAPDDSQLRQNSPAPMPQGPGHNPTENDFNAVAAS